MLVIKVDLTRTSLRKSEKYEKIRPGKRSPFHKKHYIGIELGSIIHKTPLDLEEIKEVKQKTSEKRVVKQKSV